jgi:hypothetical protein
LTTFLSTNFIEFVPVIIIGFIVSGYKSLKSFLEDRENQYKECEGGVCEVKTPRLGLTISRILTDGIGGSIIGSLVYGLMSLTEYTYTIKICLAAVAAFIGVDKVIGYVEQIVKKKANIPETKE